MDLLGHVLRATPHFKGRGRLVQRWLHQQHSSPNRSRTLPGGNSVACDLSIPYEAMVWLKAEEEQDLHTLRNLLRPDDTFIDCGANIGLWTLEAASVINRPGHVIALEPNPHTFEKLSANVHANHLTDSVRLHNAACGANNETLPFHCSPEHNISEIASAPGNDTIDVPVMTLDSIASNQPVQGIKLDIEGFEMQALLGARDLLNRSQPWLCVEFNTIASGVSQIGDWNVHQFLTDIGYQCRLFHDPAGNPEPLTPDWTCPHYTNLFYSLGK